MTEANTIRPLYHTGPICAIAVIHSEKNLVLEGKGPLLVCYDYAKGTTIFQRQIFARNKIHGIKVFESSGKKVVAIFGGRSLTVIPYSELANTKYHIEEYFIGDWILDVEFSIDGSQLYCLSSHNVVTAIDLVTMKAAYTKNCNWKSILYSGCIRALPSGRVLVGSGTVMNGILIWDLQTSKIIYNLQGHKGSIFEVQISPLGRYAISCSDDRSIKVWDLRDGKLLATGWGHGNRIWGLQFYDFVAEGFKVLSCSEDCTSRIWQYQVGNSELQQLKIIAGHTGRNIWSECVDDKCKIGFTGGADGKLNTVDLADTKRDGYIDRTWVTKQISDQCQAEFDNDEKVKYYCDFGIAILAVSSKGKILLLKDGKWTLLFTDDRFSHFALLSSCKTSSIVTLGNNSGTIVMLKFDKLCKLVSKREYQVTEFPRLGNMLTQEIGDGIMIIAESPNPHDSLCLLLVDKETFEVKNKWHLVKPQEKVGISSMLFDEATKYLVVGSRYAIVLLYDFQENFSLVSYYKNKVKGDSVSDLVLWHHDASSRQLSLLLTMKNERYYIIKICHDRRMEILEDNRLRKTFLKGSFMNPTHNTVYIYGFKSDYFYIWNATAQTEYARVICGGPHRQSSLHYWFEGNELRYRFTFTRAADIKMVQNCTQKFASVLDKGLHGREVRSMAVVKGLDSDKLLISGGEDTTIKLSTLESDGTINMLWTQRQHGSGLQSIHSVNDDYILSSSAREELFLWKVFRTGPFPTMTLYRTIRPISSHPDLRVMDFDSIEVKENGKATGFVVVVVYSDSHIRMWFFNYTENTFKMIVDDRYKTCCLMSVHFLTLDRHLYLMTSSTRGNLVIYDIDSCVERYFILQGGSSDHFLSMKNTSTAMSLAKLGNIICDHYIHQSSIRDLDFIYTSEHAISIVTGGDDNAIGLIKLEKSDKGLIMDTISFIPDAAASTVTCVKVLDDKRALVASVDQKVRLWGMGDELKLLQDTYTTVADTGCIAETKFSDGTRMALIGGAGVSTWRL